MTHLPEVQTLNLLPLLHALQTQSRTASESGSDPSMSSSSGETETETETETEIDAMTEAEGDINCMSQTPLNVPPSPPVLCLVLATDGVWYVHSLLLLYSILFYSILFYSILFYSILFSSIQFAFLSPSRISLLHETS